MDWEDNFKKKYLFCPCFILLCLKNIIWLWRQSLKLEAGHIRKCLNWIIDPRNETIWVYAFNKENKYELFSFLEDEGIAQYKVLEGFELAYKAIFAA